MQTQSIKKSEKIFNSFYEDISKLEQENKQKQYEKEKWQTYQKLSKIVQTISVYLFSVYPNVKVLHDESAASKTQKLTSVLLTIL